MFLPAYVILDLETTGGTPLYHRITEIALIRFEHGVEIGRWETLVNPGVSIPSFISGLTGITNEMVQDAPLFEDIAHILAGYLEGAVLAAHNVRFDYGFLESEYRRLGMVLRQKVMCTVKLSRKLYPHHHGHSLDAIMARHGLTTQARHRAMGDVELVIAYLELTKRDLGEVRVLETLAELLKGPCLLGGLDAAFLDEIPDSPGVYLLYGEKDLPLYIGKGVNLRSRVLAHFNSDRAFSRDMRIAQEIKQVEWIETAGELGTLLLESRLIKERQPVHNRRRRASRKIYSLSLSGGPDQVPLVNLVTEAEIHPTGFDNLHGLFRSKRKALNTLHEIVKDHRLCPRAVGTESSEGARFAHPLQCCNGVCASKGRPDLHYLRLKLALVPYRLKGWPYPGKIGIRERDAISGRTQLHIFEDWCHIKTVEDENELEDILTSRSYVDFDLDTYKLLQRTLKQHTLIISYSASDRDNIKRPGVPAKTSGLLRHA